MIRFISGVVMGLLLFLGGWVLMATWRVAGGLVTSPDDVSVFLGYLLYGALLVVPLILGTQAIKRAHLKAMGAKRKDKDDQDAPPPPDPDPAA